MQDNRYPIGKFMYPKNITSDHVKQWMSDIESLPERLSHLVSDFTEQQLKTSYREGGWTARPSRRRCYYIFSRRYWYLCMAWKSPFGAFKNYFRDLRLDKESKELFFPFYITTNTRFLVFGYLCVAQNCI